METIIKMEEKRPIRVMLIDDHQLFRVGLMSLLKGYKEIEVIGDAENGQVLLKKLKNLKQLPDVVLLDLNMPVMNGIDTTKKLKEKFPSIKIIILTMQDEEEFIVHLINEGANSYLLKNTDPAEMIEAIITVMEQNQYFNSNTTQVLLKSMRTGSQKKKSPTFSNKTELTKREKEILTLICEGLNNNEISEKLFISPRTVEGHRSNLLSKTATKNSAALVAFAVRNNLIDTQNI